VKVVVLTGAGISAESGVATFRDAGGLWEGHRVEDVATPEGFEADPDVVHHFYDARRRGLEAVEPNAAHLALAALEGHLGDDLLVVTQNVDDLHERAGSTRVLHMHGELRSAWCTTCDERLRWDEALSHRPPCPRCGTPTLRPDVVWFGELPYGMERIEDALSEADQFVSIGTSGEVYPAAGFMQVAAAYGAHTLELNLVPSSGTQWLTEARHGPAGLLVPAWVAGLLP